MDHQSIGNLLSTMAFVSLLIAAVGNFHQFLTNLREGSTEAIEPFRFGGMAFCNLIWAAWAGSLPTVEWPVAAGCGLHVVIGSAIALQVVVMKPARSALVKAWCCAIPAIGAIALAGFIFRRAEFVPWRTVLQWASVGSSIALLHFFTCRQSILTWRRGTAHGVSLWQACLYFSDWAVFLPYPIFLIFFSLDSYWQDQIWNYGALLLNTLLGLVTSAILMIELLLLKARKRRIYAEY